MDNKKHCSGCNRDLVIDNFSWKNKTKGTYQRWCKECQAKAYKAHYQNNSQVYKARALKRNYRIIAENRQKLYDYLSTHICVDCGCNDIRVLEFDHVHGKKVESISRLILIGCSWGTIQEEIDKCEVRCANCHRIMTSKRGSFWRNLLDF